VSSVGSDLSRRRGFSFLAAGALVFIVAIGVTAGTGSYASQKAGLYALYVGLFAGAIFLLVRGVYFCTMKVSHVDGPV